MSDSDMQRQEGLPSKKVRLTLLIGFGGLLALMLVTGLEALDLARQLHVQEETIRRTFLAHTQPLMVLSSSICVYNDRVQEYLLSQDPQAEGLTADEFSRLTAEVDSMLNAFPDTRPARRTKPCSTTFEHLFAAQQGMMHPILSWNPEERHRQALRFLHEQVLPEQARLQETSERIALWNRQQLGAANQEIFASFSSLQARQSRLLGYLSHRRPGAVSRQRSLPPPSRAAGSAALPGTRPQPQRTRGFVGAARRRSGNRAPVDLPRTARRSGAISWRPLGGSRQVGGCDSHRRDRRSRTMSTRSNPWPRPRSKPCATSPCCFAPRCWMILA